MGRRSGSFDDVVSLLQPWGSVCDFGGCFDLIVALLPMVGSSPSFGLVFLVPGGCS